MPRDNWVPVFLIESFDAEEPAVSDVLESPKAVLGLRQHPLWHRGEGKQHGQIWPRYWAPCLLGVILVQVSDGDGPSLTDGIVEG